MRSSEKRARLNKPAVFDGHKVGLTRTAEEKQKDQQVLEQVKGTSKGFVVLPKGLSSEFKKKRKMTNWEKIEEALKIVGLEKPNCMFIAADVKTDYLHFARVDYKADKIKSRGKQLEKLGVVFVGKYETLAIEREELWDNMHE